MQYSETTGAENRNTVVSKYRSYVIDLGVFFAIFLFVYYPFLHRLYAPFFLTESSLAFRQFSYYIHALHTDAAFLWDTYVNLAQASVPITPLFSPVTLVLILISWLFDITRLDQLATLFALANYAIQILLGYSMYLFLRYLSLGRLAAIVGGIGYSYNFSTMFFGMGQGYLHTTPLMIAPLAMIFALRLFRRTGSVLFDLVVAGFLLGLCIASNGDIKPSIYFIPLFVAIAYFEGYKVHGLMRTSYLLAGLFALAAVVAAPQIYPTYETIAEASSKIHAPLLPSDPLDQCNTVLGFSQNTFSMVMGYLFPTSYFNFYNFNPNLGIAWLNSWEMRFSFGFSLTLLACAGIFYRTRMHVVWFVSFTAYLLFILGTSTPLWPVVGFISQLFTLRMPTRASIMIYFLLSLYAAYGVEVVSGKAPSAFYGQWFRRIAGYLLVFLLITAGGLTLIVLQDRFGLFAPITGTDNISLAVSGLFLAALFIFAVLVLLKRPKTFPLTRFAMPVLLFLFTVILFLFIFSGYFIYNDFALHEPSFKAFKLNVAKTQLSQHQMYSIQGLELYKEFFNIISAALLGLVIIMAGYKYRDRPRFKKLFPLLLTGLVVIAYNTGDVRRKLPPSLEKDQSALFGKDAELSPLYDDPVLSDYRIALQIPGELGRELGFDKNIYGYCCRQYQDGWRFAFGADLGPGTYGSIRESVGKNYNHPFWRLYNVKYIVDDFDTAPYMLPSDPVAYERLSDKVIKFRDAKPIVFFMDKFTLIDRQLFTHVTLPAGGDSLLNEVYLHDRPEREPPHNDIPLVSEIKVLDTVSGRLRADIVTNKAGFLVFSEVWDPSWRVYVDGAERKVLKAYGMLQAVYTDAGGHEILFEYSVFKSWQMRTAVAACFAVLVLVAIVVGKKFWHIG